MDNLTPEERTRVRRLLLRWGVPARDAEDLVQEVALAVARCEAVEALPGRGDPRSLYVVGVAHRQARFYAFHHRQEWLAARVEDIAERHLEPAPGAEDLVLERAHHSRLFVALAELRAGHAEWADLLVARYVEGTSVHALAARADVSENTIYNRLRLAKCELAALVRRSNARELTAARLAAARELLTGGGRDSEEAPKSGVRRALPTGLKRSA